MWRPNPFEAWKLLTPLCFETKMGTVLLPLVTASNYLLGKITTPGKTHKAKGKRQTAKDPHMQARNSPLPIPHSPLNHKL